MDVREILFSIEREMVGLTHGLEYVGVIESLVSSLEYVGVIESLVSSYDWLEETPEEQIKGLAEKIKNIWEKSPSTKSIASLILSLANTGRRMTFQEDMGGNSLSLFCNNSGEICDREHFHLGEENSSVDMVIYDLFDALALLASESEV